MCKLLSISSLTCARISGDFDNLGKVYVDTSIKQLNIFILLFSNVAAFHADRGNVIKSVFTGIF